ncbi:MAG: ABC transporter substrate-binding protein [Flavobacteriaceae bacterium]|nr:ABC transporter substrate-binding protein [Flavobacteriaceae bacterium]
MIDYNNWEEIYSGNFKGILSLNGGVFFYDDQNIYSINNNQINNVLAIDSEILDLTVSDSKIIITSENQCLIYNDQLNELLLSIDSEDYLTNFNNAIIQGNDIFIGTSSMGVLKLENFNPSLFSNVLPNGPLENNIFSVESLSNQTWVSYGDYTEYFNPYPLKFNGISSYSESSDNWINISKDSISNQAVNLNNIAISPFNNKVFVSSFHGGLLEIENYSQSNFYNEMNSGLESLTTSDPQYRSIRISDIEFDNNGLLWILNSRIDSPLKSFNLGSNNWTSYDFTQIINDGFQDELGFNDIEIDDYGNKWIASLRSGLIGFNENSGSSIQIRKVYSQDQSNMPSSNVKSIAVDNNNHLWIGTIQGLRVLYNTSNFFESSVVSTQQIVILEDGIPRELLEQQYISDIEVDGANNKWVGTIGSGVFYFSPNGQQTIYHFTKENSPLPSNNINDISVNLLSGKVFFATDKGLVSYNTGSSSALDNFSNSYVYPNPVRPSFNMAFEKIKIDGLTDSVNIKITDIEGNLVAEAQSNVNKRYNGFNLEIDGGTAFWNGKNLRNVNVSSGVYIIMLSDLDTYETKILKLMVVR